MNANPQVHEFDVCVIGGGMAGMCAALAAARNGARAALVHDRPVYGGNASSEVRMWICGAHGEHNKETGLLEEIQLENQYANPDGNYSVWDSVLWAKVHFQPGLTAFLNCTCADAAMEEGAIRSVTAWQLTSQTWHEIRARYFIDCSGDSVLAPLTGAEFRTGREARAEFNEDIEPEEADAKTMGNSLLIQFRRTAEPRPFVAQPWAYKFTSAEDLPHRVRGINHDNFWWIEVGGLQDTIKDAEAIHDELMRITYGVADFVKNRFGDRAEADQWAVDWIGSLPGKRENRRYMGDHIMTQHDVRAGGRFEDIIAYGGWSMDDHHPAGIYFPGKPTIFHPAPSPFGIPYRSLYSRNIPNLLFAGRNISVTHAALSATRVMGTCATLGQAAGTAAALCARHGCTPRGLSTGERLQELQATLMEDDAWLPGLKRELSPLALSGCLSAGEQGAARLLDGMDRDRPGEEHAWCGPAGAAIEFRWPAPVHIGGARLVLDSDLNQGKHMPNNYPSPKQDRVMPGRLAKAFRIEALAPAGNWETVYRAAENRRRLVRVPLDVETIGLRLVPEATWGGGEARVFAFEPLEERPRELPEFPDGPAFSEVRAKIAPKDLEPPHELFQ